MSPELTVLWRGVPVSWHHVNKKPDDGGPGFAIICMDDGHHQVDEHLEIYCDGQLWFHSPDVWFPGHVKAY